MEKGRIFNSSLGINIIFQYNPESFDEEKVVSWNREEIQGMVAPLLTFQCGDARQMDMKILFDAFGSPHPAGHILGDLNAIRCLAIPYDHAGNPVTALPAPQPISGGVELRPPGKPGGVPPLVKLACGGRVLGVLLSKYKITEELHGITPAARDQSLPIRAWVDLSFIVIDDYRMLADYKSHAVAFHSGLSMSGMTLTQPGNMLPPGHPTFTTLEQNLASVIGGPSIKLPGMTSDFWNQSQPR